MKLDGVQSEIVSCRENKIVVVAGAGSGKTRVLTERVKSLIEEGVEPHNIVAITFTNLAADEIKERLHSIDGIGDAFLGTIHSFANRIYKTSGKRYSLLTEEVYQKIYMEILARPKYRGRFTIERFNKYLDLRKDAAAGKISEEEVEAFLYPSERGVMLECKPEYTQIVKRDNIITFDELLQYSTEYYKSISGRIQHLLIDELQDIDSLQYEFVMALNAENYFFVGDDWQAIYGWKGGNVEIFKSLVNNPDYKVFYMMQNYRNSTKIIQTGTRVISQVPGTIPKSVIPIKDTEGQVSVHQKCDFSQAIDMMKRDKKSLRDWFVLTRTNKEAFELSDIMREGKIPHLFVKKGSLTLAELREAMQENCVKLMTVHSAKGLESPKVILYGNFPIGIPAYRMQAEERRLMYVGITRAEEELHIFN